MRNHGDYARPGRKRFGILRGVLPTLATLTLLASACGEDEPELTIEQHLASVEGRELTETEVADKLATAGLICQMDEQVLDALWQQLNERQLNFQDVVFSQICPDRSVFYAGLTGRYVTEEAENSGVVTSTTRPISTTVAPSTSGTTVPEQTTSGLTPRATIAEAPSTSTSIGATDEDDDTGATTSPPTIGSATTRVGEGG